MGRIYRALQERLGRLKANGQTPIVSTQLEGILRRIDKLPVLDSRTPDEVVGYNDHGLPHY
jgi:antitoxin VapB